MKIRFTVSKADAGGRRVTMQITGGQEVELIGRFSFDRDSAHLRGVFQDLNLPSCSREQIAAIGEALFRGICPEELCKGLKSARSALAEAERKEPCRLCLVLPPDLRTLPWSALADPVLGISGASPRWSLQLEPSEDDPELLHPPGPPDDQLKILVVVPVQTNLNFAREQEAIKRIGERFGPKAVVKPMPGRVTLASLRKELEQGGWDVVHYIGHGTEDTGAGVKIMLNSDEDVGEGRVMVSEALFANSFIDSGVRLVVLSCCFGASQSVNEKRSLSGLGPHLLGAGVPAVVAMRFEVSDSAATQFSDQFYESLLLRRPGRIDDAAQAGRRALECLTSEGEQRACIAPVLYAAPGGEILPLPRPAAPAPIYSQPPPPVMEDVVIPSGLEEVLVAGRCLVVAGGPLALVGATRDVMPGARTIPTLDAIARELAGKIQGSYPQMAEIDDMKNRDEGSAWSTFERVCQYFKSRKDGGRLNLERELEIKFGGWPEIPEVFRRMANWNVTGIIYCHLDGFLRQAASKVGNWDPKNNPSEPLEKDKHVLVALRGWPADRSSLRLTREDAWEMFKNISRMSPTLTTLAQDRSDALLLLGPSPADGLIQFLVNTLLDREQQRDEKPIYFAAAAPDAITQACWHRFHNVTWMGDLRLESLVRKIDAIVPKQE